MTWTEETNINTEWDSVSNQDPVYFDSDIYFDANIFFDGSDGDLFESTTDNQTTWTEV